MFEHTRAEAWYKKGKKKRRQEDPCSPKHIHYNTKSYHLIIIMYKDIVLHARCARQFLREMMLAEKNDVDNRDGELNRRRRKLCYFFGVDSSSIILDITMIWKWTCDMAQLNRMDYIAYNIQALIQRCQYIVKECKRIAEDLVAMKQFTKNKKALGEIWKKEIVGGAYAEWERIKEKRSLSENFWCLVESQSLLAMAPSNEPRENNQSIMDARKWIIRHRIAIASEFGEKILEDFDKQWAKGRVTTPIVFEDMKAFVVSGKNRKGRGIGFAFEQAVTDDAIQMQVFLEKTVRFNKDGSIFALPPERIARTELRERIREGLIHDGSGKATLSILEKTDKALNFLSMMLNNNNNNNMMRVRSVSQAIIKELQLHYKKWNGVFVQNAKAMTVNFIHFHEAFLPLCSLFDKARADALKTEWFNLETYDYDHPQPKHGNARRIMFVYKNTRNLYIDVQNDNYKNASLAATDFIIIHIEPPFQTKRTEEWIRRAETKVIRMIAAQDEREGADRARHRHAILVLLSSPICIRHPCEIPEVMVRSCFYHIIQAQVCYHNALRMCLVAAVAAHHHDEKSIIILPPDYDFETIHIVKQSRHGPMPECVMSYILRSMQQKEEEKAVWCPPRLKPILHHPTMLAMCTKIRKIESVLWDNFAETIYKPIMSQMRLEAKVLAADTKNDML